jgi:hypothetical protein
MSDKCKPGGCSSIGCEGGHYCFNADGSPKIVTDEKRQELARALDEIFSRPERQADGETTTSSKKVVANR